MKARLILLGPPGSGKGTQAKTLKETLGIAHVSTGDIFRDNIANGTALGKLAQDYIDNGNLVPDGITNRMVHERLSQEDAREGFLLDGYPRNETQVTELDSILASLSMSLDAVILLRVPEDTLVNRLLRRAEIEGRVDDTETVIRHRLDVYHSATEPLITTYRERGKLIEVDGTGTVDAVHNQIIEGITHVLSS